MYGLRSRVAKAPVQLTRVAKRGRASSQALAVWGAARGTRRRSVHWFPVVTAALGQTNAWKA